eukprot:CAMPEP_0168613426 /NCGR_PEP_ID=MMETSP0449_2-20121227/3444_1 /TAXON_ID=1082188 /ORGANISM="Strombidium rassoulzadegani, Strain ras09" /LENGTH=198 /DNA_ID=CAMNT_0008654057 /DNA_START=458 /DNA_END=1054 /DNA_ORIENTATION=+
MEASRGGLAVADGDVDAAVLLEHALALLEHDGGVEEGVVAAEEGVDGGLVDADVEVVVGVLEVAAVHDLVDHVPALHVAPLHLLDDHVGDVDVPLISEPVVVQVLREVGVAAAEDEDLVLGPQVLAQQLPQRRVVLQPVERGSFALGVPLVPVVGVAGDAGVRAYAQTDGIFVGMVLILIFSEAIGLYGLIVAIIISQ